MRVKVTVLPYGAFEVWTINIPDNDVVGLSDKQIVDMINDDVYAFGDDMQIDESCADNYSVEEVEVIR